MQDRTGVVRATLISFLPFMAGVLTFGLVHSQAIAGQVTLRWDYTASGAAGFVLYCGPASRNYRTRIDVGNAETYTMRNLPEGSTSYCAVTAYDPSKVESAYSNELRVYVPGGGQIVPVPAPPLVPLPATTGPRTELSPPVTFAQKLAQNG
jgi:hypothetical protein